MLTARSEVLFSAVSLQAAAVLSAGRHCCEGKEGESRNDVYDRKSFYDALLTLRTAQCTMQ